MSGVQLFFVCTYTLLHVNVNYDAEIILGSSRKDEKLPCCEHALNAHYMKENPI